MKVYEMNLKVYLLKDISAKDALEKISKLIDKTLTKEENFLGVHTTNRFKNYTFNSFFQLEKSKIYKEGTIYTVKVRTIDDKLQEYLRDNLVNEYTDSIKVLTLETKIIPKRPIEKIYSITPVIVKTDSGYWKGNLSLDEYEKRIKENIIKKYNQLFNTKIDENFEMFNMIRFDNKKPISCKYKNIHLLGDKITLKVADNEMAQKLAYLSLGTGLLEINARGYGFVNYRWV
ncbi:CRISPR-associated endoribonuclease Cas6 [Haloimpatiens sp. FM7315]|uniref:CRISPR-associated endoribonuclease Cas6 n=1 Tax=Haloimpatiens sp. FM7315 TaxID=3298609 RepID=UPI0035A30854